MIKSTVYVETTIPSFYHEDRTTPDIVARRQWTREWWDLAGTNYDLFTSVAVLDELSEGRSDRSADRMALLSQLPLLPIEPAIADIVESYIQHRLMPADPAGDALHLAIASFHKCDFLVTWNCRHLANANKFGHLRRINTLLGLFVPALVTPLELLGGSYEGGSL
jgi:predicted nucleic acid-binding protein